MLEIFAYAIGIMYTPGPINLLGLHSGMNGKAREYTGFCLGVASAMFILFILLSFLGEQIIYPALLPYISLIGCSYILYIAWKVIRASVKVSVTTKQVAILSFWDGLTMQLLNPKGLVATLPISTIQFPAAGVSGGAIFFWSFVLAVLAFGAPKSYSIVGMIMGKKIENPAYFKMFNLLMSGILVFVAMSIGYEHVYLKLISSR
jgi:threonine/homoserine/homoserine lactone efflux protein